jgi:hypothetical protein
MSDTTPQPARKDTAGDPGSVVEFPGTSEGARPSHNLPLQLSSFIGRERETAEASSLLADNRLDADRSWGLGQDAPGTGCGFGGTRWVR